MLEQTSMQNPQLRAEGKPVEGIGNTRKVSCVLVKERLQITR